MMHRKRMAVALLSAATLCAATSDPRLIDAVKKTDKEAVRSLINQRSDVNQPEADGATALHWAAHRGDLEIAELLLRAGANVKAANRYGVTPLYVACSSGNASIVERLLAAGADANTALPEGETALMTAARTGSVETVKALLDHGANVNPKEGWRGQTALMWAVAENHPAVAKLLIERGAEVHLRTNVSSARPQFLLPAEHSPESAGFTALLFAVREGHLECVRVLLAAGADPNEKLANGTSALVLAVMNAHYELAAALLDKGADPNADAQGWTALHQLIWSRDPNRHFNIPPPIPDGKMDSLELAKALVAHGANVNARMTKEPRDGYRNWMNRIGATAFLLAAKAADAPMMRFFLEHGADPKITAKDGTTTLMAAAGIGYWQAESNGTEAEAMDAVKLALELGDDVNAANDAGYTALHGATVRGANSIVQLLADKGAKLDAKTNKEGWTALAIADGVFIANTYKAQPHTAALLRKLMADAAPAASLPQAR
jgi:ankyrin repeat protein